MSKPVEGGMSGINEQLSDLFKGSKTLGEEIASRTTTTIIPAQPGFELLSLECAGEVCRRPIVGWSVTKGTYAGTGTLSGRSRSGSRAVLSPWVTQAMPSNALTTEC